MDIPILFDTVIVNGQLQSTLLLLRQSIESLPQGGIQAEEMGKRLSLKSAIAGLDGQSVISLNDADLATAKEVVAAMSWQVLSPFIYAFILSFK